MKRLKGDIKGAEILTNLLSPFMNTWQQVLMILLEDDGGYWYSPQSGLLGTRFRYSVFYRIAGYTLF